MTPKPVRLVVYGDFNCPYSCLASTRVDHLLDRGIAEVEWRAVEHDPTIPAPSRPVTGELAEQLEREVHEVATLVADGETFPIARPPIQPNTARSTACFAEVEPSARHEARRALFAALWFDGLDIGDAQVLHELLSPSALDGAWHVADWRDGWLGAERRLVPMLVLPDGRISRGLGALSRLKDMATQEP